MLGLASLRHSLNIKGEGSEQVLDGAADQGGGLVGNSLCQRVLGASVDERDDGTGMGLADDRVAFPVTGAPFVIDDGRSFADVRPTGDAAATGGALGGLAAAGFAALAEAGMELAAVGAVLVNAAVEPGAADGGLAGESQSPGDLLGAQVHLEHVADAVPDG